MPRLPDRFDLWIRKARTVAGTERQLDLILGGLVSRRDLYFLNIGSKAKPLIAKVPIEPSECALVFTGADRLDDFLAEFPAMRPGRADESPMIISPTAAAMAWCVDNRTGLVINPGGETTTAVPPDEVARFVEAWRARGERQAAGFWIPNMTTEEEDFWQEHGL